ncbi:hypothetical protein [Streptoalloteichus hindustanus]|uniref:Short C-terminal domain-containing protein n=1 Tax=Streptoalloteichus hindustanus TaxID=2017 RepID=A0A1M4V9M2_STRHI|nr:hypothetical protein [Streptoalloteichus hindustanus]SHE65669.1 hypothetical protein SAMN05444320_101693 [Streptoalloteichus hindustanus]
MSWQDELQQLDNALAAGHISAEEYRQRRGQLQAAASQQAVPGQSPSPAGNASPTPATFSPTPFRWDNSPENTQVMDPVPAEGAAPTADATQVVSGDQTQVVRGADADRTQVVRGGQPLPTSPPYGFPAAPANQPGMTPGWGMPPNPANPNNTAPWADSELPPDFGNPGWLKQGPEVFDDSKGDGKAGRIIAIVAVVVLLLGIGGGIWWFATSGSASDKQPEASGSSQSASPTSSAKPRPAGPFVEQDGKPVLNRKMPIAEAVQAKAPTEQEAKLLKENGVTEISGYVVNADADGDKLRAGLWAFTGTNGVDPRRLLGLLDQYYANAKYEPLPSTNDKVVSRVLPANDKNLTTSYRAHYTTSNGVIRVEAYGKDAEAAKKEFEALLAKQLEQHPAK